MKLKIFLLILLVQGTVANIFGQFYDVDPMKVTLSSDKSEVSLVSITEETNRLIPGKYIVTTVYDTIDIYAVSAEAKKYITEELAISLLTNGMCILPDSLVPRWTQLFGKETYIERELEITNHSIVVKNTGTKFAPAKNKSLFYVLIFLSIPFVVLSFIFMIKYQNKREIRWLRFVLCVLFVLFYSLPSSFSLTLLFFDSLFYSIIIISPAFLVTFIKFPQKQEQAKESETSEWYRG